MLKRHNRKLIGHYGKNDGFTAAFERFPDEDVCVIVLSNQDFRYASTVSRDLAAILFGEKYDIPKEHRAVKVDPVIFERYVGLYEVASGKTVKIWRKGNRLMQEAPTGAVFEFIPESEKATEFIVREGGGDPSTFRRVK